MLSMLQKFIQSGVQRLSSSSANSSSFHAYLSSHMQAEPQQACPHGAFEMEEVLIQVWHLQHAGHAGPGAQDSSHADLDSRHLTGAVFGPHAVDSLSGHSHVNSWVPFIQTALSKSTAPSILPPVHYWRSSPPAPLLPPAAPLAGVQAPGQQDAVHQHPSGLPALEGSSSL